MANNIIVTTSDGREVELTMEESAYLRALRRLEKMNSGRILLFGNGTGSARLDDGIEFDGFRDSEFETIMIRCDGGDGGD